MSNPFTRLCRVDPLMVLGVILSIADGCHRNPAGLSSIVTGVAAAVCSPLHNLRAPGVPARSVLLTKPWDAGNADGSLRDETLVDPTCLAGLYGGGDGFFRSDCDVVRAGALQHIFRTRDILRPVAMN
jgi:hypothetical protein